MFTFAQKSKTMKKIMMVSLLLTAVIAVQAQLKIAPKMQKGTVKTYVTIATTSLPMQGDAKVTSENKYTVVDVTSDGYLLDIETVSVEVDADANNIAGKLIAASEEMQKGTVVHFATDKDGKITKLLNADELKQKMEQSADGIIEKMFTEVPMLSQVLTKEGLKAQLMDSFTEEVIIRGVQETTSPLSLNGKTLMTGSQEDYVSKDGMKMKRMYFVNGHNIIANANLNMSEDEMKELIIKQAEERAPEQAKMIKENIDQVMASGVLKINMEQKDTFELHNDGWVKSITTENVTETMGQKIITNSTTNLK